jgi:hypothetical protein
MPISPRDYPMTLEEIAEAMNSNKKAVAMVIATALRKIRRRDGSLVQFRQFFCDEVFKNPEAAREHFGSDEYEGYDAPGCVSPLRADENIRLKEVNDAREHARKMQAESKKNDEAEGLLEEFRSQLRRYFGDDCTSVWSAGDRYDNIRFERDQLVKKTMSDSCI